MLVVRLNVLSSEVGRVVDVSVDGSNDVCTCYILQLLPIPFPSAIELSSSCSPPAAPMPAPVPGHMPHPPLYLVDRDRRDQRPQVVRFRKGLRRAVDETISSLMCRRVSSFRICSSPLLLRPTSLRKPRLERHAT